MGDAGCQGAQQPGLRPAQERGAAGEPPDPPDKAVKSIFTSPRPSVLSNAKIAEPFNVPPETTPSAPPEPEPPEICISVAVLVIAILPATVSVLKFILFDGAIQAYNPVPAPMLVPSTPTTEVPIFIADLPIFLYCLI